VHVDLHGSSISWRFSWLWLKWFLSALILMVFQDVLTKSIEVVLKHWHFVYYMMESAIHPKRVRDPVQERDAFCSGLQVVVVQQESLVERIVPPHTLVDGECWRWSFCHHLSSIPGSCQCCGGLAVEDLTACASVAMNSAAAFGVAAAIADQGLRARNRLNQADEDESVHLGPLNAIVHGTPTQSERWLERFNGEWRGDVTRIFAEAAI
jgi:hypothetical protein